jgi:hypothetical protein
VVHLGRLLPSVAGSIRPRLCENALLTKPSQKSTHQIVVYRASSHSGRVKRQLKTEYSCVFTQPRPKSAVRSGSSCVTASHITPATRVAKLLTKIRVRNHSCVAATDLAYCFLLLFALTRGLTSTNLLLIVREPCRGDSVSGAAKSSSRASNTTRYPMEERRLALQNGLDVS